MSVGGNTWYTEGIPQYHKGCPTAYPRQLDQPVKSSGYLAVMLFHYRLRSAQRRPGFIFIKTGWTNKCLQLCFISLGHGSSIGILRKELRRYRVDPDVCGLSAQYGSHQ